MKLGIMLIHLKAINYKLFRFSKGLINKLLASMVGSAQISVKYIVRIILKKFHDLRA